MSHVTCHQRQQPQPQTLPANSPTTQYAKTETPKLKKIPLSFLCHPGELDTSVGDKVISVTLERYFWRIYGEKGGCLVCNQKKWYEMC